MMDISERVKTFECQIINYRAYNLAYMTILRSIQATQMRGVPSCAVLIAPSGCGKTTLLRQIQATFGPVTVEQSEKGVGNVRPTIYCGLPTKATIKSFAKSLLNALEFNAYGGDAFELTERVVKQIALQKVTVAFVDEFQMLSEKKSEIPRNDVMNGMARLVDRTGIPFVAAGSPAIKDFFYDKDILRRRFPFLAQLGPLQFSLEDTNSDWQMVLQGLDKKMYEIGNLEHGVHLHEPEISLPLFAATSGIMEDLRLLLSNVFSFALSRNDGSLRQDDFSSAFDITRHAHCLLDEVNPFTMEKSLLYNVLSNHHDQ